MNFIKQYPTPTAGLALGFSAMLWNWSGQINNPSYANALLIIAFVVGLALIAPILIKFGHNPRFLIDDLKDPTIGSVAPTVTLTLMVLSYCIHLVNIDIGAIVWSIAVIAHLYFLIIFAYHRFKTSDCFKSHLLPSWFVPTTGLTMACLTLPMPSLLPVSKVIFVFGTVCWIIIMPSLIYKLCLGEPIKEGHKPTLALLTTPSNLILAGMLSIYPHANPLFAISLFGISCLMSLSVYVMLFTLCRLPFSPAYAALTFPLAAACEATLRLSEYAAHHSNIAMYTHWLYGIGIAQGVIASIVILYVLFHFLKFFHAKATCKANCK